MADGTTKLIERIRPGDMVMAGDPDAGTSTPQEVAATIVGDGDKNLISITTADGGTVTATDGHPFWIDDDGDPATLGGRWIDAAELRQGQWLRTSDGRLVRIAGTHAAAQNTTVYNLTVDNDHTYHVLAGNEPVLVHNCGGKDPDHADSCRCANGARPRPAVQENEAGRFGDLDGRSRFQDDLTPNHIPQAKSGRIENYRDYAAHMMKDADHRLTRTYGGAGRGTARLDAGLTNRQVVCQGSVGSARHRAKTVR